MCKKCPFPMNQSCPSRCTKMHRLTEEHWCYDGRYGLPGEIVREEDNKSQKIKHLGDNVNVGDDDKIVPKGYLNDM